MIRTQPWIISHSFSLLLKSSSFTASAQPLIDLADGEFTATLPWLRSSPQLIAGNRRWQHQPTQCTFHRRQETAAFADSDWCGKEGLVFKETPWHREGARERERGWERVGTRYLIMLENKKLFNSASLGRLLWFKFSHLACSVNSPNPSILNLEIILKRAHLFFNGG